MRTSLIVCLGLAVALAGPQLHTTAAQNHTLAEEDQRPLLGIGADKNVPARLLREPSDVRGQAQRSTGGQGGCRVQRGRGRKRARAEGGAKGPGLRSGEATRRSFCTGVVIKGKCYVFFREPKKPSDAEFFCQDQFSGGHLASITSYSVHRSVMNMMLQQNGAYTRTWIGGLRFLDTGRFIWLDGSRWGYADWLPGEPNHTAGKEHCLELLPHGSGKFNDFTCWEPQAFICSYPY